MSAKADSDACTDTVGEDDREKSGPQDQQLSPFHKITLPHSTDLSEHTVGVGSPQAAAPKIKKPAMMCNSTGVRDGCGCQAPATRGRRAKNRGRKKTSQTTTSSSLETDALSVTVNGQVLDGTTSADDKTVSEKKDLVSGVAVSEKKDLVCVVVDGSDEGDDKSSEAVAEDSDLSVSGRTYHTDVTSDVEQKQPSRDAVVGRRCTSVPAAKSRQRSNRRQSDESHKITEYFPIRRSSRMTGSELKKQELSDIQDSIRGNKHDGLKVVEIECKGRGVVASRPFKKGEFVVEYAGDLVDLGVAKQRENSYSVNQHVGCYMYYFQHRDKNYCVDATEESGLLGRLVNHSRLKFNCATKVVEVDNKPRLILVAARDIRVDEELLYDYGDRSKESLEAYPWLAS